MKQLLEKGADLENKNEEGGQTPNIRNKVLFVIFDLTADGCLPLCTVLP